MRLCKSPFLAPICSANILKRRTKPFSRKFYPAAQLLLVLKPLPGPYYPPGWICVTWLNLQAAATLADTLPGKNDSAQRFFTARQDGSGRGHRGFVWFLSFSSNAASVCRLHEKHTFTAHLRVFLPPWGHTRQHNTSLATKPCHYYSQVHFTNLLWG